MTLERVQNFLGNPRNAGTRTDARQLLEKLLSFDGECAYCGHPMERDGWDHIDHIEPVSYGGSGAVANLVPACSTCNNNEKGAYGADGWFHRLSVMFPHWPGAMLPEAVAVRAAHGMDEDMFLALRAAKIETHGEGREREDERREREEAARIAAEVEQEQARIRHGWLSAQNGLIEAEVQRRLALIPPKAVTKEVTKVEYLEVERVNDVIGSKRRLVAVFAAAVCVGMIGAYAVSEAISEPEVRVRTVTKTVQAPPKVVTKVVTKRVEVPAEVAWSETECENGYRDGYDKGRVSDFIEDVQPAVDGTPAYIQAYTAGYTAGSLRTGFGLVQECSY